MAEIALSVSGWVASPIVSSLLKEGFSYLGDGDGDIEHRLENLETTILPQFQLVIEAAERSNEQHKSKLKQWLRKLKDAMHEAEDTLDLYKYQLLEKKVNDLNSAPTSKSLGKFVGNLKKGLSSTFSPPNKKLRDSLIKLENIAAEAKSFYEFFLGVTGGSIMTNNTTIRGRVNTTTSLPPPEVFGRDDERDQIIDKYLLDPSEACESEASPVQRRSYSVVVVVGIGGAGKTTLAQHVYHDQRVVDNFGIKMWVCISRKLDVVKFTKEMIESASKKKCNDYENLDALQMKLIDLIKSKKVLLVLDDIWCYKSENEAGWEQFLAPLAFAKRGSKILVTTRPENRGNMPIVLHPKKTLKLKDLRENELISLFMHYAFQRSTLSDTHLREELTKIGKQILQKLNRSPLAAKAVGCQLSKKLEINFWKATLEKDNLTDSREALIWSYQRLEAPLQRCFSYFSLFYKGYSFKAKEMVHLWIAEGFISTSNDTRRMEDIGNDYWDELVSGSFLQLEADYDTKYGTTKYYNMHDLFHDLAERVSEEDCFRMEYGQVKEIPRSIRHLSIWSETMGKCSVGFHKLENLRTLLVNRWRLSNNDRDLLIAAIEKFEKLRVLKLSSYTIKSLPKYIGDLKHLRYLDISGTGVAELPLSLGKLHHLQVLDLTSSSISSLPRSLKNLSNLRYLKAKCLKAARQTLSTLPDIGKLTSLQGLKDFEVKKEKGCDIGQLKNLNELRGSLTISHLENVDGKDQAIEASLKDKKHLDKLWLMWRSYSRLDMEVGSNTHLDMEVVEGLRPPLNLTELYICDCQSLGCPSWLIREGCLENLRSLCLDNTSFEDLPTISKLSKLIIWRLPNLRALPFLPQNLEKLVINGCPLLVFVSEEELQNSAERKKSIMTILQSYQFKDGRDSLAREYLDVKKLMESEKVDIPEDFQRFATNLQSEEMATQVDGINHIEAYRRCQEQKLAAIFARKNKSELFLPSSLQELIIGFINITDGALSLCLEGLTSLKSLFVAITTITRVPTDHLMSLSVLKISWCCCLKSLGALHPLLSLKKLSISSCPCLELEMMESDGRISLPHSLQSLKIDNSTNTKRFCIGDLPDLVSVKLRNLPLLESLSLFGLTALRNLDIQTCPELSGLDCSQALNSSFGNLRILNCPKLASASLSKAVHFDKLYIDSDATLGVLLSSSKCLAALRGLYLCSCTEVSFLEEHFNCLTSLEILELHNCKVQSLPRSLKNLSSLAILYLVNCPHVSSLSSNLPESLKDLYLRECEGISSLPMRLPESLRSIDISGCPVLKKRCREAKGEDWPKIAHIPFRDIKCTSTFSSSSDWMVSVDGDYRGA